MQQEKQEKRQPKKHRWLRFAPQIILGLGLFAAYFSWRDSHRKLTQQELDVALTRYMQGKYAIYGDTLTPVGEGKVVFAPNDLFFPTTNQYELEFETEKYPKRSEKETVVLRYNYEENTLRDTYMSFVLREQVEEKFREIFDRIYEPNSYNLVVRVQAAPWKNHGHSAVETVDEYLRYEIQTSIYLCVIRDVAHKDMDMERLLELIKSHDCGIKAELFYMNETQYKNEEWKEKWFTTLEFDYEDNGFMIWNKGEEDFAVNLWEKDRHMNENDARVKSNQPRNENSNQ